MRSSAPGRYSDTRWMAHPGGQETPRALEPRFGKLERSYQNISLPAVEREAALEKSLVGFDPAGARPYAPELAGKHSSACRLVAGRMPGQMPYSRLQNLAAEECRQAAGADHLRDFRLVARIPKPGVDAPGCSRSIPPTT